MDDTGALRRIDKSMALPSVKVILSLDLMLAITIHKLRPDEGHEIRYTWLGGILTSP